MRLSSRVVVALAIADSLYGNVVATTAVGNCTVIPGDPEWPSVAIWKQELPGAKEQESKGKQKHTTYRIEVKRVDEVTAAINFASKYNLRLTLLNSGHDFLGRNDAPNGLAIVTTGL